VVILVAVLMSSVAAALLGFILIAVVSVMVIKGMIHMLGSPDDDEVSPGMERQSGQPEADTETRPDPEP
jgi:hypothetical protein